MSGDFFRDPLPRADVITMGNILHGWDEGQKKALVKKAYDALNPGGMLIAIEAVIDDARRAGREEPNEAEAGEAHGWRMVSVGGYPKGGAPRKRL